LICPNTGSTIALKHRLHDRPAPWVDGLPTRRPQLVAHLLDHAGISRARSSRRPQRRPVLLPVQRHLPELE
jgi:hypothetical protein